VILTYVEESFLTGIPESSCRDNQPCIVSNVDFSFKVIFVDWEKCGFGLSISTDFSLSVPQSLSLSCSSLKCSHPDYI